MTKIINNNLWSPVPWGWGCNGCNGGNNWLNNIFGYQMMFGMMNNMFSNLFAPQQRQQAQLTPQTYNPYGNFYPGLSLGGATQGNTNPSYEEYMEKMQAQNDLTQLKQTWSEFKFSNVGGKYQAVLKADKSVVLNGDTTDELMSNIIGYVNENPTQFKTKEKAEKVENDTDKDGAGGINEDDTPGAPGNNDTAGTTTRKVKQDWYMASNSKNQTLKAKLTYDALAQDKNKAAEKIAEAIIAAWGNQATGVSKEKLRVAIIKANPGVFNQSNGNLINNADMYKLDLPTINWMKEHCTTSTRTPATPRTPSTTTHRNLNGKYLVAKIKDFSGSNVTTPQIRWDNGNMIYKSVCINNDSLDSDLVIRIDGYDYTIDGEDFFRALGKRRTDGIFEYLPYNSNSNIINPKNGKFNPQGIWPEGGFKLACATQGTFDKTKTLKNSRINVVNGKVYLIVGQKKYLMDDVMNGTIKSKNITG